MRFVSLGALAGLVASLLSFEAVRASSLTTLAVLCGAIAAAAVAAANYRERFVFARRVRLLADPTTREATLARMRRRVEQALASGDPVRLEQELRDAVTPLLAADRWDDVATLARMTRGAAGRPQRAFSSWLAGVHAIAELHRGDLDAAEEALAGQNLDEPWLRAIDAVRLALGGQAEEALDQVAELDERGRLAVGARFGRDLAEAHALAALGRRAEARERLEASVQRRDGVIQAAARIEGPASPLARSIAVGAGGPFRSAG